MYSTHPLLTEVDLDSACVQEVISGPYTLAPSTLTHSHLDHLQTYSNILPLTHLLHPFLQRSTQLQDDVMSLLYTD